MKVTVWNMQHKAANWPVLDEWDSLAGSDIALLSEASPAPAGVAAIGSESTIGLEALLGPSSR